MAQENLVGNTIEHHADLGYFMNVFDHRPETLEFMENAGLQGGGPTWMGLIAAALELETPDTLRDIDFNDEADVLLVTSSSEAALKVVQSYVSLLMSDESLLTQCIEQAQARGYLE